MGNWSRGRAGVLLPHPKWDNLQLASEMQISLDHNYIPKQREGVYRSKENLQVRSGSNSEKTVDTVDNNKTGQYYIHRQCLPQL